LLYETTGAIHGVWTHDQDIINHSTTTSVSSAHRLWDLLVKVNISFIHTGIQNK